MARGMRRQSVSCLITGPPRSRPSTLRPSVPPSSRISSEQFLAHSSRPIHSRRFESAPRQDEAASAVSRPTRSRRVTRLYYAIRGPSPTTSSSAAGAMRRSPSDGIAQIDPPVAIAFAGDPRARPRNSHCSEGHGMPGLIMCPHSVALEHEAQTSAPQMAFQNDSARTRQASRRSIVHRVGRSDQV